MKQNLFLLLLMVGTTVCAQSRMESLILSFSDRPELSNAIISIDVKEVSNGRRIASYDPQLACIPASTQKLLTTGIALDVLGEDHRFTTRLVARGRIEGGTLYGNLIIVGGGDPSLGSPFMDGVAGLDEVIDRWAAKVTAAGIKRIEGAVVGDGSYFGTGGSASAWPWSDLGNYYGAGSYGINLHENSYFLYFTQRQREGSIPPVYRVDPEIPGLKLNNELRSGPRGSGDQAYIYGAPFNYDNFVRGTIPVGSGRFRIRGSVPDPPLFAAQTLHLRLAAQGVVIAQAAASDRTVGGGNYADGTVLDERQSPTLAALIDRTNLRSNNLYAETLLREVNKARGQELYDLAGTQVLKDWLKQRGLATEGIQLQDGSGLATRNFFSAAFMTDYLLLQADERRWRESIPLAGRTGSLRGALRGTPAEGRLRAKSGSLGAARAYAGYVERQDGRELAFSIMVNNYTIKSKDLNRLLLELMKDMCTAEF